MWGILLNKKRYCRKSLDNRRDVNMKQIIVFISSIVLGIAIAGMILGFETSAQTISTKAVNDIATFSNSL